MEERNYEELKEIAIKEGATLFGVGDVSDLPVEFMRESAWKGLSYGISMAVRLSKAILEDIVDHPTKVYFYHYRQLNIFLDQLAIKITNFIQNKGYRALPIPASQVIDWQNQRGHLSHKEVARRAGLGWIGRNNLLVTPQYGAQVRLVTVLTDYPLKVDTPLNEDCGDCYACLSVCPAGAIKERKEDFDHIACYKKLDEFRKKYNIGHHICGVCVKVCGGKR